MLIDIRIDIEKDLFPPCLLLWPNMLHKLCVILAVNISNVVQVNRLYCIDILYQLMLE